jgi:tetratricopeptide (TPR) repeat protein
MDLDAVSEEDLGRTPCIAPGCDPSSLRLSAAEGYLLSRIDGHTSWRLLREIGGLTPDEVDLCIEMWLGDGVIEMGGFERKPKPIPKAPKPAPVRRPGEIDESQIDPGLEIPEETQRRILEMESRLGCGYAELLGVAADASEKDIKKAYRALSRDFHPDRYFRKQIGDHKPRLEAIFKKVLEAYELLSDPATRAEVQKAMAQQPPPSASGSDAPPPPPDPSRPLSPIERLRQRMPFKIPQSILNERRARAKQFYDSARTWAENGHHLEAASSIRLAIAFDPHEELYKTTFAGIRAGISDARIKELLKQAAHWSDPQELRSGLKECEEMLLYRPHDPELNCAAATAAVALGQGDEARELAERAVEHSPDVARYHRVFAEALAACGDKGHAIRELETALELDSGDAKTRALLEKMKPRRAVHGGTK